MARRRTAHKRKRFEAPSISALLPGTLDRGKPSKKRGRSAPRKRKKSGVLSKITAHWEFSHYVAALIALASLVGLFLLLTDTRFTIDSPTVTGNSYLETAEVIRRAELDGANVFLAHTDEVVRRLALIPQVKEARVQVGLPNRAVISIIERQPLLNYVREGETYWVDEEGQVFPAREFRIDLPVLLDDDGSAAPDGKHMNPALGQAILFLNASIPDVNEYRFRSDYGLYFITPEGWRVLLGNGENMESKLRKWQNVRQQLLQDGNPVKEVDIRFDKVYVKR